MSNVNTGSPHTIVVHVVDGVVQNILSDRPLPADLQIVLVDEDQEAAEPDTYIGGFYQVDVDPEELGGLVAALIPHLEADHREHVDHALAIAREYRPELLTVDQSR